MTPWVLIHLNALEIPTLWQPSLGSEPSQGHLLVVLHGRGDSPQGFAWLQSALALPGLSALLLTAPDPYYGGYSWYDLPPRQLPGILRSRSLLEKVFVELARQGFPPERCILLGFSQGCLMTLEFGARFSPPLAGYIGISGYCNDPRALLAEGAFLALKGNWLITHGTDDDVLPVARTRAQIEELQRGGMRVDYREYPKGHTIEPRFELPEIREWIEKRLNDGK